MLKVILSNAGGVLDVRSCETYEDCRAAAIEMISECAYLCDGDKIEVVDAE